MHFSHFLILAFGEAAPEEKDEKTQKTLRCSACGRVAEVLREHMAKKMPKKVKSRERRGELATGALGGGAGEDAASAVCEASAFKDVVRDGGVYRLWGESPTTLTSRHFEILGTKEEALAVVMEACRELLQAHAAAVVTRVKKEEGRAYGALKPSWFCGRRVARLCDSEPEDVEEEEEEGEKKEL